MNAPIIKEIAVKSVLTKSNLPTGDFSVNPYIGCTHACKYCYASFMKRFTNHEEPWGEFIDVKYWEEIKNPRKYAGREIIIGSVTDPYNPQEKIFMRTRAFLSELAESGAKITIITKSDLILRDLDLIRQYPDARVSWSMNTLDETFRSDMDCASPIEARLAAMKAFHDAGVRTTCFISPIFPGITDVPSIMERVKEQCNLIWLENLNLRGSYKQVIIDYIAKKHPELSGLYREIYMKGDRRYWESLDSQLRDFSQSLGLDYVTNDDSMQRPFEAKPVVVNYFYHSEIKKSAQRSGKNA